MITYSSLARSLFYRLWAPRPLRMKPEYIIEHLREQQKMSTTSTTAVSLTDFSSAVEKLEATGSNWVIFKSRFLIAVKQKKVYGHFDGSSKKPVSTKENLLSMEQKEFEKELTAWQDKEDLAHYLLTQKLPDAIFTKYLDKSSVAEIWAAIILEFMQKSMLMRLNLHAEFMGMQYEKSMDLQAQFDKVCMKYVTLLNVSISISKEDYRSLVINFVPPEILTFLANISAGMKAYALMNPQAVVSGSESSSDKGKVRDMGLDAEALMQIAAEEWERREAEKKGHAKPSSSAATPLGTALVTVSSEKPGTRAGGGRQYNQNCHGKFGECWNCGGKGHRKSNCPSPKGDNRNNKKDDQSGGNSGGNKGPGPNGGSSGSGSSSNSSSSSKKPGANSAVDESVTGAWTAMVEFDDEEDFDNFLTEIDENEGCLTEDDDAPSKLMDLVEDWDAFAIWLNCRRSEETLVKISFRSGECRGEANLPQKFDDNHGPNGDGLEIDEKTVHTVSLRKLPLSQLPK